MTIAEALAALAAAPTDTLKHASLPASWTALGWQSSTGTWSETEGLTPPGFTEGRPAGTALGIYYNASKRSGNTAALMIHASGSDPSPRQWEVWLHATPGATPTGYQALLIGVSGNEHKAVIREWKEGTLVKSAEAVVNVEQANSGVAAVCFGTKVSVWYRENAGGVWKEAASIESSSFSEGFPGVGGNGSNPRLVNFAVGKLSTTWELGGSILPGVTLSGPVSDPTKHLAATIAATTTLGGALRRAKPPSGTLAAGVALGATLNRDKGGGGPVRAEVVLGGLLSRDKTPHGVISAAAALSGPLELLPRSQSIFLQFELDRTSIPYTAERR